MGLIIIELVEILSMETEEPKASNFTKREQRKFYSALLLVVEEELKAERSVQVEVAPPPPLQYCSFVFRVKALGFMV